MYRKPVPDGVMCSEILSLHLQAREERAHELKVNLEQIWPSGALFQTEVPIRPLTSLWFAGGGYQFRGHVVAQSLINELGYFVEMGFHPSCVWSERKYRPKHLFNPAVLLANKTIEATLHIPISQGLLPATFTRMAALNSFRPAPRTAF